MNRLRKLLAIFTAVIVASFGFNFGQTAEAATNQTLLNTYGSVLGKSGVAVESGDLANPTTLNAIKAQYNSITLVNEMKPNYILNNWAPTFIPTSQGASNGYYIPSSYNEGTVPQLNFSTVDNVLQICYNNGLKVRLHTLLWHAQTPDWFFRTGYSSNGAYVSQAVMNARMEFYIKSFIKHICTNNIGRCVYAVDVVNEYLNAQDSGWSIIYGRPGTQAPFVKNAFQYAYDCLASYGLTNNVKLFYNDYNEYMISSDIIALINYINSGTDYCAGIGMQSHLGTSFPSVAYYRSALQAFVNAGFEVQITELDVGNTSEWDQAVYVKDLLTAILQVKQAGGNITGITWWGLSDNNSWRQDNPLLFSSIGVPKGSYYAAIDAYNDVY